MNPIAFIEATAAGRSAVLGALATDPAAPSRTAVPANADGTLTRPVHCGGSAVAFLSADRRQSYCRYEAPSPDEIIAAARRAGLPADVIVEVNRISPEMAA